MKSIKKEKLIINLPTKIFIKSKILQEANIYLNEYKNLSSLVVIDSFVYKNKNKLNYILKNFEFIKKLEILENIYSEPTFDNLKLLKRKIRTKNIKIIYAIGGGSTIDISKGLSISLRTSKKIESLQGQNKFSETPINLITIPTIFGSGAEITSSAVFINTKNRVKGGINSNLLYPKICLIDPYLAKSNKLRQHIICSFDALVHSIESFTSVISNTFTKEMSILGATHILKGIDNLKNGNIESFENLALGSIFSIISLMHSEQNLTGAASYRLAVNYKYNHAYCGASFLENSLLFIDEKNNKLLKELVEKLFKNKVIKSNNLDSLVNKLKSIKKKYNIKNIALNENQKKILTNEIIEMPMLDFSPVKIYKKDIFKFLSHD